MKPSFAICLIVAGAFLVSVPVLADFLERGQIASVLKSTSDRQISVSLGPSMSGDYRTGCYVLGAGMIAVAVVFSFKRATQ